jgi:hypothetical protein
MSNETAPGDWDRAVTNAGGCAAVVMLHARCAEMSAHHRAVVVLLWLPIVWVRAPACPPAVKGNDMMLAIYVASLIRSVLALHKLIDNKEQRMAAEKEAAAARVGSAAVVWVVSA